jgi:hypothetical protein
MYIHRRQHPMPAHPNTPITELALLDPALDALRGMGLKADARATRQGDAQLRLQFDNKTMTRIWDAAPGAGRALRSPALDLAQPVYPGEIRSSNRACSEDSF